jgi:hypothetical protein
MASRTFLDGRRYRTDDCAKECKDVQNDGIAGWTMYQHLPVKCASPQGSTIDFQYDHPNLRARPGVGLADSCVVDRYSALRNDPNQLTRDRCHIQLFSRIFQGCPNLRPGDPNTDVEGPLVQGTNNGGLEGISMPCKRSIMEVPMANFVELLPCMAGIQDPKNTVEAWTRGGDDTRSWVRRQEMLKACAPEHLRQQRF